MFETTRVLVLLALATLLACEAAPPLNDPAADKGGLGATDVATADANNDTATDEDAAHTVDDTNAPDTGVDAGPDLDTPQPSDTAAADLPPVDAASPDTAPAPIDVPQPPEDSVADTAPADAQPALDIGPPAPDTVDDTGAPDIAPLPSKCTQDAECIPDKPCLDPTCEPDGTCTFTQTADEVSCDNGIPCTTERKCFKGVCLSKPKICDGSKTCHSPKCDEKTGNCVFVPNSPGKWCNDGQPCTNTDRCQADGSCKGKPKKEGSSCKGKTPCMKHACKKSWCVPTEPVTCNDLSQCTFDSCDPKYNSCTHKPKADGTGCDDGIACTEKDACKGGHCWGKEVFAGCNGLPAGKCGDLKCQPSEKGYTCSVDCLPKPWQYWMMLFTHCKKDALKCMQNEKCMKLASCLGLCKWHLQPGASVQKCYNTCNGAASASVKKLFKAAEDCAHKLG